MRPANVKIILSNIRASDLHGDHAFFSPPGTRQSRFSLADAERISRSMRCTPIRPPVADVIGAAARYTGRSVLEQSIQYTSSTSPRELKMITIVKRRL